VLLGPLDAACQLVSLDPLQVSEAPDPDLEPQEDLGLPATLGLLADFLDVEDLPEDHVSVYPRIPSENFN